MIAEISSEPLGYKMFFLDYLMGSVSAVVFRALTTPIEVIKVAGMYYSRHMNQPAPGFRTLAGMIIKNQGITALWKGVQNSVVSYFPNQALIFTLNDYFKRLFGIARDNGSYPLWLLSNCVVGGAAGAASLLLTYPIDNTKIKLMNMNAMPSKFNLENKPKVDGFVDFVKYFGKTVATDGLTPLYKGFVISCLGVAIYRSIYFGVYGSVKPILPADLKDNFMVNFFLAWAVTIGASTVSHPVDIVRRVMMKTNSKAKNPIGWIACARKILATEGIKSFFNGASASVARGITGAGVLALYDRLQLIIYGQKLRSSE